MSKYEGCTPGPWQVVIDLTLDGVRFGVREHVEAGVAINQVFWHEDHIPSVPVDDHGYFQPDDRVDLMPHNIANARLIADAPTILAQRDEAVALLERADAALPDESWRLSIDIDAFLARIDKEETQ